MTALRAGGWLLALAMALASPAAAQTTPDVVSAILTVDQDALFARSKFGQALTRDYEAEAEAIKTESREIDTTLEAEERALTERRATMSPEDFRPLAETFDLKVEALRSAQDAKAAALSRKRDEAEQRFVQTVGPILGDVMISRGAYAIVNRAAIVVSLGAIDITDEVIAAIDAKLGDGSALPPAADLTAPDAVSPPPAP